MKRTLWAVLFVLLLSPVAAFAQSDPCVAPSGSQDTILVGQKPVITWTMDPAKDAITVGFNVTVSNGVLAKTDIGKPVPAKTCTNGFLAYQYVVNATPGVGSYLTTVVPWNNKLDGSPQEGTPAARPFVVANQTALPGAVTNLKTTGQ